MATKREDFIWTVGYQDDVAIVDGPSRRKFGRLTAAELLEGGMYRAAFCAALYDQEVDSFLGLFREHTGRSAESVASLQRLFGVFSTPDAVQRVRLVG